MIYLIMQCSDKARFVPTFLSLVSDKARLVPTFFSFFRTRHALSLRPFRSFHSCPYSDIEIFLFGHKKNHPVSGGFNFLHQQLIT